MAITGRIDTQSVPIPRNDASSHNLTRGGDVAAPILGESPHVHLVDRLGEEAEERQETGFRGEEVLQSPASCL